jgi:hypothetical protein
MMYQAGVAALNSQISQQNANYASQSGELQAAKYGVGARATEGHIVAGEAASGLDVKSGSAKSVQESQHTVSTMDMDTIRMNATKTAYDYEVQANQFKSQAAMDVAGSQNIQKATQLNVASSLVGGAGSVAQKWLQGNQMGLFSGASSTLGSIGSTLGSIGSSVFGS